MRFGGFGFARQFGFGTPALERLALASQYGTPTIEFTDDGTNPPPFNLTSPDISIGWWYQLDYTANGATPDGNGDVTMPFTSDMAIPVEDGGGCSWGIGPFTGGATIKWRVRYGPSNTGPWSPWSAIQTAVMTGGPVTNLLDAFPTNWTESAGDLTTGGSSDPDGGSNASTITEIGGTSAHAIYGTGFDHTNGHTMQFRLKAKMNTLRYLNMRTDLKTDTTIPWATFDLQSGTAAANGSVNNYSITSLGGGWYECMVEWITFGGSGGNVVIGGNTALSPPGSGSSLGTSYASGGKIAYIYEPIVEDMT